MSRRPTSRQSPSDPRPLALAALVALLAAGCDDLAREARRIVEPPPKAVVDAGRAAPAGPVTPGPGGEAVTFSPPASFAPVYRAAAPSVVNISAMSDTGRGISDTLKRLYDAFGVEIPHERFTKSRGTGFVVDGGGRVVTNWHIVEGTTEIAVRYIDDAERHARVERHDEATDLALLAVDDPPPHPALAVDETDAILPGEWVLAIGNAVGLGHTATAGIVSAKGREGPVGAAPSPLARMLGQRAQLATDFLQVDASINEGNSGGPLLDVRGRVAGVNTYFGGDGPGAGGGHVAQGVGFAIPASALRAFLGGEAAGTPRRAFLGVQVQDLTGELAASLAVAGGAGALVVGVIPGSPAEAAGFSEGDVVTAIDDEAIRGVRDLKRALANADPAAPHRIAFWRGGREEFVSLLLKEPPAAEEAALPDDEPPGGAPSAEPERHDYLGLKMVEITPHNRARLGTQSAQGVYLFGVDPAGRAGLRKGDVIESCDGRPARKPTPLAAQIQAAKEPVRLYVRRDGAGLFVMLKR